MASNNNARTAGSWDTSSSIAIRNSFPGSTTYISSEMMESQNTSLGTGWRSKNAQLEARQEAKQEATPEVTTGVTPEGSPGGEVASVAEEHRQAPMDTSTTCPQNEVEEEEVAVQGVTEVIDIDINTNKDEINDNSDYNTVIWWNCAGGILSKIDYLNDFCRSKKSKPLLIFISEAEVNDHMLGLINLNGYSILTAKTIKNGKSRVICYINEKVKSFKEVKVSDDSIDVLAIDIQGYRFVGLYKGFKTREGETQLSFFNRYIKVLTDLTCTDRKLIIGGDFNVDLNKTSNFREFLEKWSLEAGLTQIVKENTRRRLVRTAENETRLEQSLIDHVYTNCLEVKIKLKGSVSDHDIIELTIVDRFELKKRVKLSIRDWRFYDKDYFDELLQQKLKDKVIDSHGLIGALAELLEKQAPYRVIRVKDDQVVNTKLEAMKKKRDRFLKRFKKKGELQDLEHSKSYSRKIKKLVKKEKTRAIQAKACNPDPRKFWQVVNNMLGKNTRGEGMIEVDGVQQTKAQTASLFANFFQDKVTKLSRTKIENCRLKHPETPVTISKGEIIKALEKMRPKMSSGLDGIPQFLFKNHAETLVDHMSHIFNSYAKFGIPTNLKTARVTAIHKKGCKKDVNNYRPVSNLSSLTKIYEKCILNKLNNELDNMEGNHQHGFREGHSTETALLTIQSEISEVLDKKENAILYSVDLSAAFDLLRPDTLTNNLREVVSEGLLFVLNDFLLDRTFLVQYYGANSELKSLDRGCVQGSILGPKLFNLYLRDLSKIENETTSVVSYADDTYVLVRGNPNNLITQTEEVIKTHIEYLEKQGMCVNETKTEVMWIGPEPVPNMDILINGKNIKFVNKIKALGVTISNDLKWEEHANNMLVKGKKILGTLKYMRRYLNEEQFMKSVANNFFSTVFYANSVWYESLKKSTMVKFNSMYFRLLRTATRDFKREIHKADLIKRCKRATPNEWARYSTSSKVIKIIRDKSPIHLFNRLKSNLYMENRRPGLGFFYDNSANQRGKQSIQNRLPYFKLITEQWTDRIITDDAIRILLKKTFFTYCES